MCLVAGRRSRCECPCAEASSSSRCSADALGSRNICSAGRCDFTSRLSASQALKRLVRSSRTFAEQGISHVGVRQLGRESNYAGPWTAEEQPPKMARLTAALCLSCASAMSYHNPVKAPQRTGTSFLPANCRVATQRKQTKIRRTHASREKRAARRSKGAPAPLLHSFQNLPRPSRRLPGEKSGPSASRPRRPRARRERSPGERWELARALDARFSPGERKSR